MSVLVDRYDVGAPLGRVADATVHAATDQTLHRPVVVTVVPPAPRARVDATLLRAHTGAALSHPNLLTVLDAGESDEGAFVVTERIEGRTLADRLAEEPLEHDETVAMLDAVLAAVEGLHAQGMAVGGFAPWQVRLGVDGLWSLAVLPAAGGDAAPLPLGGPTPEVDAPDDAGGAGTALRATDLVAVGRLVVAALGGQPLPDDAAPAAPGETEPTRAALPEVADPGLRALAAAALAAGADDPESVTAAALRERLPGGAPRGLPATLGLPAPDAALAGGDRRGRQRLRRVARALTAGAWG